MKEKTLRSILEYSFSLLFAFVEIILGLTIVSFLQNWYSIVLFCCLLIFIYISVVFIIHLLLRTHRIYSFISRIFVEFESKKPRTYVEFSDNIVEKRVLSEFTDEKRDFIIFTGLQDEIRENIENKQITAELLTPHISLDSLRHESTLLIISGAGRIGKTTFCFSHSDQLFDRFFSSIGKEKNQISYRKLLKNYWKDKFSKVLKNKNLISNIFHIPIFISCRYQPHSSLKELVEQNFLLEEFSDFIKKVKIASKYNIFFHFLLDDYNLNSLTISHLLSIMNELKDYNSKFILTTRTEQFYNDIIQKELEKTDCKKLVLNLLKYSDVKEILQKNGLDLPYDRYEDQEPKKVKYADSKSVEISIITNIDLLPHLQRKYIDLLRHPLYLYLYITLKSRNLSFDISIEDLFSAYFKYLKYRVDEKLSFSSINFEEFLEELSYDFLKYSFAKDYSNTLQSQNYIKLLSIEAIISKNDGFYMWHSNLNTYLLYKTAIEGFYKNTHNKKISNLSALDFLVNYLTKNETYFLQHFSLLLELLYCSSNNNTLFDLLFKLCEENIISKLKITGITKEIIIESIEVFGYVISSKYLDFSFADRLFDIAEKIAGKKSVNLLVLKLFSKIIAKDEKEIPIIAKELLENNPNDPVALNILGGAEMLRGNFTKAIEIFEKGLKENPDRDDISLNLSYCYYFSGNREMYKSALKLLESSFPRTKIVNMNKRDTNNILMIKGAVYSLLGKPEIAIRIIEEGMKEENRDCRIIQVLAFSYIQNNQPDKAISLLKHLYYDLDFITPGILYELSRHYLLKNSFDKYQTMLNNFEKFHPNNYEIFLLKGTKQELSENYEKAKQYYYRSLEVEEKNYSAHVFLSSLLLRMGETKEARFVLEKSVEQYPESDIIKLNYSELLMMEKAIELLPSFLEDKTKEDFQELKLEDEKRIFSEQLSLDNQFIEENSIYNQQMQETVSNFLSYMHNKKENEELKIAEMAPILFKYKFSNVDFEKGIDILSLKTALANLKNLGPILRKFIMIDDDDFEEVLDEIDEIINKKRNIRLSIESLLFCILLFSFDNKKVIILLMKMADTYTMSGNNKVAKKILDWVDDFQDD